MVSAGPDHLKSADLCGFESEDGGGSLTWFIWQVVHPGKIGRLEKLEAQVAVDSAYANYANYAIFLGHEPMPGASGADRPDPAPDERTPKPILAQIGECEPVRTARAICAIHVSARHFQAWAARLRGLVRDICRTCSLDVVHQFRSNRR